ncbi:MAG: glycogen debranching enzyme GlgX [Fibrobacterota bacterium]|jgi:glycogen operon protein
MRHDRYNGLGATPLGEGVRFAVHAPDAHSVALLRFHNKLASRAASRHELSRCEDGIWECEVDGARIGDLYAYSVQGPGEGRQDVSLDPHSLLLDPWAIEIGRLPRWELDVDPPFVAPGLARVAERRFDWDGVGKPQVDPTRRVIYEAHVKGLTKLHPGVPERLRGTYAGICHPEVLSHLKSLGVTTLELLPVHAHMDDRFLLERGLTNFWGYSTLSWFAPHPAYASVPERSLDEFRTMVRELHRAGIEVVLDVVYNHSSEAGDDGPDLSLRGFGPWYLRNDDGSMRDLTGCGNTLDFSRESVRRFVLQSLRHWAENCQIDGFRFDLASVHGRGETGFDPTSPFFREMAADSVLAATLRIAEPWDATREGYGLGRYPSAWMEWNDRFRDDVRLFWKGEGSARAFALRLAGSPDIFVDRPYGSSVNYVACHDGFTTRDLVTWSRKHNESNREGNRDGSDWNHSDHFGVEGDTADPAILERRARRVRNLLASALMAQGTPMILGGDELGRTQDGNNNAYCQDNPISWLRWNDPDPWPPPTWFGQVLSLRAQFPAPGGWDWIGDPDDRSGMVGILLRAGLRSRIVVANRSAEASKFDLPPGQWRLRLDSGAGTGVEDLLWPDPSLLVEPCTMLVLDSSH